MKTKVVTFTKKHIYGGHVFNKDDKLELPVDRAATLEKAGVVEGKKKKKGDS